MQQCIQRTSTNRSRTSPRIKKVPLCNFERTKSQTKYVKIAGDDSEEATPVPIPNTEVKLFSADCTWTLVLGE